MAGGTLVGIMFSLVTYRGNSVAGSVLIHFLWNLLLTTDILHIFYGEDLYASPLFTIGLPTDHILITGGGFGVEASLAAIMGYFLVCLSTKFFKK